MDLKIKDKVFFVSGSSSGIGLGIAISLLKEGCNVIINGRKKEKLDKVKNNLSDQYKDKIIAVCGDVNKIKTLDTVKDKAIKKWGQLDGVIANAGGVKKTHKWDIAQNDWDWYFANNFSVAHNTIQPLIPLLIKRKGSIVIIGSIAAMEELGAPIPYSSSKAALLSYTKSLSNQLANEKIRVNIVSPGNIYFPDGNWEKKQKSNAVEVNKIIEEKVPLKMFGEPEDIGNIVVFLVSPRSRYITGANFVVDGGQTIGFN